MFIPKNFVLSIELSKAGNIELSNFSNFFNLFKDSDDNYYSDIFRKFGECTLININHPRTPQAFKDIYNTSEYKFTCMHNLVYSPEFLQEIGTSFKVVKNALELKSEEITLHQKKFIKFVESEDLFFKNKVFNLLSKAETLELMSENYIDSYIKITPQKYLSWYSVL